MNTNTNTTAMRDTKILLAILWIFFSFTFVYADVRSSLEPGVLEETMTGYVAGWNCSNHSRIFVGNSNNMGDSVFNDCPVLGIEV